MQTDVAISRASTPCSPSAHRAFRRPRAHPRAYEGCVDGWEGRRDELHAKEGRETARRRPGQRRLTDGTTKTNARATRFSWTCGHLDVPIAQVSTTRAPASLVQARRVGVATPRATLGVVAAASPEVEAAADVSDRATEAVSKLRSVRMSASKVRRVLDQVRGRSYEEALMILEFMPYRSCDEVLKCLYSASANAKNNLDMDKSKLYISHASCDEGPTLKRFRPRAQGRGFPIRKRTCNITIKVAEN